MKTLNAQLAEIQKELKAPKNQRNNFGNYNYRNCEDILEAVKPLLKDLTLVISDEIVNLGERYYVKATCKLSDGENTIENTAYARESLEKKGMDSSQITGAASSYARKYALNGLFAIDDTKDADHDEEDRTIPQKPTYNKVSSSIHTEDGNLPVRDINEDEPPFPDDNIDLTPRCEICGAEAKERRGTSKTGKPYHALFCTADKAHVKWL